MSGGKRGERSLIPTVLDEEHGRSRKDILKEGKEKRIIRPPYVKKGEDLL